MRLRKISLLGLLVFALWSGCARLPEYARPRFHEPDAGPVASGEGFGYRALAVEDFQAVALPPESAAHSHDINAHACISIQLAEEAQARITQGVYGGKPFFVGSLDQVRFTAVFMPSCSWWNPDIPVKRRAYVLQHEQIHFALTELAARRLTRTARRELKDFLAVGDSYREVQAELSAQVNALARDAMEDSFAEHTDFDEETSLYYDPRAQQGWYDDVMERLAERNL